MQRRIRETSRIARERLHLTRVRYLRPWHCSVIDTDLSILIALGLCVPRQDWFEDLPVEVNLRPVDEAEALPFNPEEP